MTTCFYHNRDMDGVCSGAIVLNNENRECEMIGVDYGDEFDRGAIDTKNRETVYVVDFSFPPKDMKWLYKHTRLVWIDHHKTAIDDSKEHGYQHAAGTRLVGIAACFLTYRYLMPLKNVPRGIKLLADYDVWNNDDKEYWNNEVIPFQYGIRIHNFTPETFLLDEMSSKYVVDSYIEDGETILKYQASVNKKAMDFGAFPATLIIPNGPEIPVIACNNMTRNSQTFEGVWNPKIYDAMCVFGMNKSGVWVFSLYTDRDDIDVSAIAKAFGGGGHRQAAGFTAKHWTEALHGRFKDAPEQSES